MEFSSSWLTRRTLAAVLCLLIMVPACLIGCTARTGRPLPAHRLPSFADDLDRASIEKAVEQSVNYLQDLPPDQKLLFHDRQVTAAWLIRSLLSFLALLHQTPDPAELRQRISIFFDVYTIKKPLAFWRLGDPMLITGYYEPLLEGSLTRKEPFVHPLYRIPPDLVIREDKTAAGKTVGRLVNDRIVPYWTRAEIEENNLLAGQELVYLADQVDAFILHVQGSGKIRLRDGSIRRVHYAAANGRPYRSIGRLLVDQGMMRLEEVNLPRIRRYLAANPAVRSSILHYNESFIFFKWEDGEGPIGSLGEPLTAGRSVAADQSCFPAGGLGFLVSEKPITNADGTIADWLPMSRFVLIQDSGSAITGPKRLDLFWGSGRFAAAAAGAMKQPGKLYILLEKMNNSADTNSITLF
jgi:membrane-bound lytic murein transglycosylase A